MVGSVGTMPFGGDDFTMRSLLFAPGIRADVLAKLPRTSPSAAVIDLEDAVPPDRKAEARAVAQQVAPSLVKQVRLFVRVNAPDTGYFAGDVLAIAAGLETVAGVVDARAITTHPRVRWCYFGAEDYVADLGGVRTSGNAEVATARAQIGQAARLGDVQAVDMVVADFADDDRFRREAAEARALGFAGKLCIHPAQVPLADEAFRPTEAELAWAREVDAAYREAVARGDAAISVRGEMVDEPVARRARTLLAAG